MNLEQAAHCGAAAAATRAGSAPSGEIAFCLGAALDGSGDVPIGDAVAVADNHDEYPILGYVR